MKNRQLDVTLQSAGLGVASLRDLSASVDVVFVPIPPDVVPTIGNPAYQVGTIPGGTYQQQDEPVSTVTIQNFLVSHEGVPEDVVYTITKVLFENTDALAASHAAARGITIENAVGRLPVPLHAGAARYFSERRSRESGAE